jgi:hypothetical protein
MVNSFAIAKHILHAKHREISIMSWQNCRYSNHGNVLDRASQERVNNVKSPWRRLLCLATASLAAALIWRPVIGSHAPSASLPQAHHRAASGARAEPVKFPR